MKKVGNISYEYQTVRLFRRAKKLRILNIYIQRGIHIIDVNYLTQYYGKSFCELINNKIKDLSIFDLNDSDTIKILDYINSICNKGNIKVQLSTRLYIDSIHKNIKLKNLIKHRDLSGLSFRQVYSISDTEDDKTTLALSRFSDINDKNLDKILLTYLLSYDKLKKYYTSLKNDYIISHPGVYGTGIILYSLLSKYKNKNYLRI